jgi:hypothetical protein
MKKLLLLFVTLLLITSCVPDDSENIKFHVEFVPVESVVVPPTVTPGQTYQIVVNFKLPTDCHYFDGFLYEPEGNVRTVAVQTIVIEDSNCAPATDGTPTEQKSFNFLCSPSYSFDNYVFKFYQGVDEAGNDVFLEVPVAVEPN